MYPTVKDNTGAHVWEAKLISHQAPQAFELHCVHAWALKEDDLKEVINAISDHLVAQELISLKEILKLSIKQTKVKKIETNPIQLFDGQIGQFKKGTFSKVGLLQGEANVINLQDNEPGYSKAVDGTFNNHF